MPFETGSVSFRMYHLPRALPESVLDGFLERVAPPLDTIKDQPVYGWVTGRHLLDRQIDDNNSYLAGYLRLCLLQAERKIPSSLLKAEMKQEELIRMAVNGSSHISRKEKVEMKQEIVDRLLHTMPPTLKGMTFVHRPDDAFLFAETLAEKQVDVFVSYLREALGFPAQVVTPESWAMHSQHSDPNNWVPCSFSEEVEAERTSPMPGHDFMTWLWYQSETHPDKVPAGKEGHVGVMIEGPLTLVMEGGGAHEISLRKGNPTQSSEAKACLLAGKKLRKATVNIVRGEQVWRLTLDGETLAVRGFKPIVPEENLDFISRFQDRMLQVELVSQLLRGLYDSFVEERKDPDAWGKRVKEIQSWAKARSVAY
ncbi:recombination-associated protein RdgC [Kiritimatiellota bacterium B12222]|nr:recombination-associated protein RdgC [Kiritimatiellota bacterium B12222]